MGNVKVISKELLSEVLGINIKRVINLSSANKVHYDGERGMDTINIYELAHKCKEWAKVQQYPIGSLVGSQCNIASFPESISGACFYADTEPEAVYKACQWILDNKDLK